MRMHWQTREFPKLMIVVNFGACVECVCRYIDHMCLYVYPVFHVCLVGSVGCYSRSILPFGLHNVCGHSS